MIKLKLLILHLMIDRIQDNHLNLNYPIRIQIDIRLVGSKKMISPNRDKIINQNNLMRILNKKIT